MKMAPPTPPALELAKLLVKDEDSMVASPPQMKMAPPALQAWLLVKYEDLIVRFPELPMAPPICPEPA
jgi:hypothetical protein